MGYCLIGNERILTATFVNAKTNLNQKPGAVVCTVKKPDGTTVTPAITDNNDGSYSATVLADVPGPWYYRWEGSAGLVAAGEGFFNVYESKVV